MGTKTFQDFVCNFVRLGWVQLHLVGNCLNYSEQTLVQSDLLASYGIQDFDSQFLSVTPTPRISQITA